MSINVLVIPSDDPEEVTKNGEILKKEKERRHTLSHKHKACSGLIPSIYWFII